MEQKQRILIVDDELRNQRIAVEIINDVADFKLASSGEEALKIAEDYGPHLILLDIMMPGIDGYEVCKQIRANPRFEATKIILVSGKAMLEEKLKGYLSGCDDYLTKPFMPEELLAKIRVFLKLAYVENQLRENNRSLDETVKERTEQLSEAEARLMNSAKMSALGEMAGGVAHEINTPLGILMLNADTIADALSEQPFDFGLVHKTNEINRKTVERISLIVRGLRNFSRDGSADDFAQVDVNELIATTVNLCGERMKNGGITLKMPALFPDLKIQCRAVEISQVLLNLLNNSFDAVADQEEKWIQLEIIDRENEILLTVADGGPMISEAIRQKLFNPFFTTKEIGKGTGLGLSIAFGIVKAHHGSLTLDPTSADTKFVIALPKAKMSAVA